MRGHFLVPWPLRLFRSNKSAPTMQVRTRHRLPVAVAIRASDDGGHPTKANQSLWPIAERAFSLPIFRAVTRAQVGLYPPNALSGADFVSEGAAVAESLVGRQPEGEPRRLLGALARGFGPAQADAGGLGRARHPDRSEARVAVHLWVGLAPQGLLVLICTRAMAPFEIPVAARALQTLAQRAQRLCNSPGVPDPRRGVAERSRAPGAGRAVLGRPSRRCAGVTLRAD